MSAPRKKRRVSTDLQAQVLSIFQTDTNDGHSPHTGTAHNNVKENSAKVSTRLINLCESLGCISKEGGRPALTTLKNELRDRVYSASELSSSLFAEDDDESVLPLCVIVDLLESKSFRARDLNGNVVMQRAVYELLNPEACSCRGVHTGITAFVRVLANDSSLGADTFLGQFVSVLFHRRRSMRPADAEARFRLAEMTIRILREETADCESHKIRLQTWLRQAVLPTRVIEQARGGDLIVWTPELSGLATGRSPSEYLENGASEERAMSILCLAVHPAEAAKVFTECIAMFLSSEGKGNGEGRLETGSWSRIVALEQRLADREAFADINRSHRRGMECTITGAICSAQAQSDGYAMAVLVCLVRRLFLPGRMSNISDTIRNGFDDHEKWLKDIVRTNGEKIAKGLIKALGDLVPLEPLRFLRANHRVFSANRQFLHLFGDYLVQVRSRIGDLDPLHTTSAGRDSSVGNGLDGRRKAEEDVVKFVTEFADAGGKIPSSLVRQMNFHRYHFRASTLPALLSPDLEPINRQGNFTRMDKDTFDEYRADLIRVMAFKRKDQAVTTAEAKNALKQMEMAKERRVAERLLNARVRPESSSKGPALNEGDNTIQMVESIFKRAAVKKSSAAISNEGPLANLDGLKLRDHLHESIKKCSDGEDLGPISSEILQGILNGLMSEKGTDVEISGQELIAYYQEWWMYSGLVLYAFLVDVLGNDILRRVQKSLQYQVFVLICIKNQVLTNSMIVALAKVVSVIAVLTSNTCCADLCFVSSYNETTALTPFPRIVFDTLPLTEPGEVRMSVAFALHCVCLFKAFEGQEDFPVSRFALSNLRTQDSLPSAKTIYACQSSEFEPLIRLLQWALGVPWRFLLASNLFPINGSDNLEVRGAAALFKGISDLLSSEAQYRGIRSQIIEWLNIELRCGWGRPLSVRRVLQRFEDSGIGARELVAESCMFVAVAQCNSHTQCNSYRSADWIVQGVTSFAEESAFVTETVSNNNQDMKPVLPHYVRKCVNSTGSGAGLRMLDIITGMSLWYFQDCELPEADLHITQFLIPCFWPFSNRLLKYLINSLDRSAASCDIDESGCQMSMFLVANLAMTWDVTGDDIRMLNPTSAVLEPILSKAAQLARAVDSLTGSEMQQLATQGPSLASNPIVSAAEQFPYAFGIALTLYFAKKALYSVRDARVDVDVVAKVVGRLVSSVSCIAAADVIDAAMHTAALIPFSCPFAELEIQDIAVANMDVILHGLLLERMRLRGVSDPAWVREKLDYSLVVDDDLRSLLCQWLGKGADDPREEQSGYLKKSLAIAVCMSRIFSTIVRVPEKELALFMSTKGYKTITSGLLPNILTVYKTITGNESDFAKEQLSDIGMQRLLCYRISAGPMLLSIISKLVSVLQSSSTINNIAAHLRGILARYHSQAEEIRLMLKTRNNLNL